MLQARYIHAGETIDFRPVEAMRAGQVVVFGDRALVVKFDIPSGALGSLATIGVFDVVKPGYAFSAGEIVHWDPFAFPLDGTASDGAAVPSYAGGVIMGHAVRAATPDDRLVRVALSWGIGPPGPMGPEGPSWIPYPPGDGVWVLKVINGSLQWVEESWSSSG